MNFRFIKEDKCPICGDGTIIREEVETHNGKVNTHCNGGMWEKRTFGCGQQIAYIPNFYKTEISIYTVCKNNNEYKTKVEKRLTAKSSIIDYIKSLNDVDDNFKEQMVQKIFYVE